MSNNEMDKWHLGYIKTMFNHESLFLALNHICSKSRHFFFKLPYIASFLFLAREYEMKKLFVCAFQQTSYYM